MHNNPLVSVIIPAYNHEKYIDYCLNSIMDDKYPNKEIIIINDGSTDNTNDIIINWINKHNNVNVLVRYVNRENRGLCTTLNELVNLAKGKYLLVLASDDALYGDTVTKRVEILEQNETNNKLVLISDALVIDNENNIILHSSMSEYNKGNKLKYETEKGIMEEVIINPSISGATSLINKKIFNIVGPYAEDLKAEDWYFYQRAAAKRAIMFWNHPVSLYRVHPTNTSGLAASIDQQLGLTKSIIKTYYRNYNKFPLIIFKLLSLKQLFKFIVIYNKLWLKSLVK